ncbi:hypothetical protein RQP54_17610 [Curvibacter sp. APW13]|uniref:hypothetical protein n=1 Tax=Curvibacter sp. APW13 TaxID=3077236 RepID=UPI0028DF87F9|nr:hypothetical protein [Curvibacter sp. APW13]MDT8992693.1 hypothetical protein [Curvibacter sp. APW13]
MGKPVPSSDALGLWWPKPSEPHFLHVVGHPQGAMTMCDFPQLVTKGHVFQAAPVILLYGKHWKKNKGFGVSHILEEHHNEIPLVKKLGRVVSTCPRHPTPAAVSAVAQFVADICARYADIACEYAGMRGDHRPLIIKSRKGTVVLEYRQCNETASPYYSVVTAMSSTKAKGTVIGAL